MDMTMQEASAVVRRAIEAVNPNVRGNQYLGFNVTQRGERFDVLLSRSSRIEAARFFNEYKSAIERELGEHCGEVDLI